MEVIVSEILRDSGENIPARKCHTNAKTTGYDMVAEGEYKPSADEVLRALRSINSDSRKVDAVIARSLGLSLKNPFINAPDLVEDVDNEWMVVMGDRWPPLPRYTGSSDVAELTAREMFEGALVDSLQVGANQFRAILHRPGALRHVGAIWPTRPLAIIGAVFEVRMGERTCLS